MGRVGGGGGCLRHVLFDGYATEKTRQSDVDWRESRCHTDVRECYVRNICAVLLQKNSGWLHFVCLLAYLFSCLSVCVSVYLFVCLYVCLDVVFGFLLVPICPQYSNYRWHNLLHGWEWGAGQREWERREKIATISMLRSSCNITNIYTFYRSFGSPFRDAGYIKWFSFFNLELRYL